MVQCNYETDFLLPEETKITLWISNFITSEGFREGEINYIFCDDAYLHKLNIEFLKHDTFTDIISFDYTLGKELSGDIFISTERVKENAIVFKTSFTQELYRVMVHGILHYMGFKDKTSEEKAIMRTKENSAIKQLSV